MGVWIEIAGYDMVYIVESVTPCVGVWIEIKMDALKNTKIPSLPAWECGLKFPCWYQF